MKARYRSIDFLLAILFITAFISLPAPASAQMDWHKFNFNIGAGVTPPLGILSKRLDTGWNVNAGGGYNFTPHLGVIAEYMYNGLGVSRSTINELKVPDASAHVNSITFNPIIRFHPEGRLGGYVIGGVGYYRRTVELLRPTVVPVTVFDPFFGLFIPTFEPANQVIGTVVRDDIGGNGGLGFTAKLGDSGFKFYTEARYHYADTGRVPTEMVPVTFGIRW